MIFRVLLSFLVTTAALAAPPADQLTTRGRNFATTGSAATSWSDAPSNVANATLCSDNSRSPGEETGLKGYFTAYGAAGAIAANTYDPLHWTNAAGSIFSANNWTTPTTTLSYLTQTNGMNFAVRSIFCSRDQEVTTFTENGTVYLRLTNDGNAIYFNHNGATSSGTMTIGIVKGVTDTAAGASFQLYNNANLIGTWAGYSKTAINTMTMTYGVSGFEIYIKINGTRVVSFQDYRHVEAGAIAVKPVGPSYGLTAPIATHLPTKHLYSDVLKGVLDARDFGVRETTPRAQFLGQIIGTTLTVQTMNYGVVYPGMLVTGVPTGRGNSMRLPENTRVVAYGTGAGGTGTYTLSNPIDANMTAANSWYGYHGDAEGAMMAGSNVVMLNQPISGLKLGDWVVVECIGTGVNDCKQGTVGVGGNWPALSYANLTTLRADTTQLANTIAWDQSTGSVWRFLTDGTAFGEPGATWIKVARYSLRTGTVCGVANVFATEAVLLGSAPKGCSASTLKYAYAQDTTNIWKWNFATSTWVNIPYTAALYAWFSKTLPLSIHAQVTALSPDGLQLTLSIPTGTAAAPTLTPANAYANITNAAVSKDNEPQINFLVNSPTVGYPQNMSGVTPEGWTVSLPSGLLTVGGFVDLNSHRGWKIIGQGPRATRLFSPMGEVNAQIRSTGSESSELSEMGIIGNGGMLDYVGLDANPPYNSGANSQSVGFNGYQPNGWMFPAYMSHTGALTQTDIPQGGIFPIGFDLKQGVDNSVMRHIEATDITYAGINVQTCANCWVYDAVNNVNLNYPGYIQWGIEFANDVGGGCVDCKSYNAYGTAALEMFASDKVSFVRPYLRNGLIAINGSSNFNVDNSYQVFDAYISSSASPSVPAINVNTNTGNGSNGVIRNPTIIQTQYIDANNNTLRGVVTNSRNANVKMFGGYYKAPDYARINPAMTTGGAWGAVFTGPNGLIDGFTVEGLGASTNITAIGSAGNRVVNSNANSITQTPIAPTGCKVSGQSNGVEAGAFTIVGACTNLTLNFPSGWGASGWTCLATNLTSSARPITQTADTTTTATLTGSPKSGDVIRFTCKQN